MSRVLEGLLRVFPAQNIVVVHGTPYFEGNAVEIVNALSRRYLGSVVWLHDGTPSINLSQLPRNVSLVPKNSWRGLWAYIRSEVVFFTHGLYGDVRPPRSRTFVNLWHGDGVKVKPTSEAASRSLFPATWVSGGTELLTRRKAADFKLGPESVVVCGNPRVEQFGDPVPPELLSHLGLDAGQRYVVWLPTFRTSLNNSSGGYESEEIVRDAIGVAVQTLRESGIRVLVKPHRQDREDRSAAGVTVISDDLLSAWATPLYALLGGSAGLITDFSSVWTDYLTLDRPIAFVIPDADKYVARRGLYPADLLEWIPGHRIENQEDAAAFALEVSGRTTTSRARRSDAAVRLGLASAVDVSDRLLEFLSDEHAFKRGTLSPRSQRDPYFPSVAGARSVQG